MAVTHGLFIDPTTDVISWETSMPGGSKQLVINSSTDVISWMSAAELIAAGAGYYGLGIDSSTDVIAWRSV